MKLHELIENYTTSTLIISYLTFVDLQKLCCTDHALHDLLYSFVYTAKRFFIAYSHLNLSKRVLVSNITNQENELNKLVDLSFSTKLMSKELTTICKIKLIELLLPAELIVELQCIRKRRFPSIHHYQVPTFIFYQLSHLYLAKSIEFTLDIESLSRSLFFVSLAAVKKDVQLHHLLFARLVLELIRLAIYALVRQNSSSYVWIKLFHDNCKFLIKNRLREEFVSNFPAFSVILDKPLFHFIKKCYEIIFARCREKYYTTAKVIYPEDWGSYRCVFSGISFLLPYLGVNTLLSLSSDILECLFREPSSNLLNLFQVMPPAHLVHCKSYVLQFLLSTAGIYLITNMQISSTNSRGFILSLNELSEHVLDYFRFNSATLLHCVFRVKDLKNIYGKKLLQQYTSFNQRLDTLSPRMAFPDTKIERVNLLLSSLEVQGIEGERKIIGLLRSQSLKILQYSHNKQHLILLLREELIGKLAKPHFSLLAQRLLSNSTPVEDLEASLKQPINLHLLRCKNPNFILKQFGVDIFLKEINMLVCVVDLMEKNYLFSMLLLRQCSAELLIKLYKKGSLRRILYLDRYVVEYLVAHPFELDYILENLKFYRFISQHTYLEKLIKYFGIRFFKQCYDNSCLELFGILKKHLSQNVAPATKERYLLLDVFMQAYREGKFSAEYIKTILQNGFLEEVVCGIKKHSFKMLNLEQIMQLFQAKGSSRVNILTVFNSLSKKLREVLMQACLCNGEIDIKKLKNYLAREDIRLLNNSVNSKFLLKHLTLTDWFALAPLKINNISLQLMLVSVEGELSKMTELANQYLKCGNVRYFGKKTSLPIFFSKGVERIRDYGPSASYSLKY